MQLERIGVDNVAGRCRRRPAAPDKPPVDIWWKVSAGARDWKCEEEPEVPISTEPLSVPCDLTDLPTDQEAAVAGFESGKAMWLCLLYTSQITRDS